MSANAATFVFNHRAAPAPVPSPGELSFADVSSAVDEEFLTRIAEILDRLKAQSEMRGYPLLASLLAIAKDEAEDDLRTRSGEFQRGGPFGDADAGVLQIAQRFSCAQREPIEIEERPAPAFLRLMRAS